LIFIVHSHGKLTLAPLPKMENYTIHFTKTELLMHTDIHSLAFVALSAFVP